MRLSLAILHRRWQTLAVDQSTLHRAIGKQMQKVDELDYRLRDQWRALIDSRRRAVDAASARLSQLDVRLRFARARRKLETCETSLAQGMNLRLSETRGSLSELEAHLRQLSPLKTLERGYAIVQRDGKVVKSPADAPADSELKVRLAEGEIRAQVI
jgi:exodeoxyribonuclease VII large subunit